MSSRTISPVLAATRRVERSLHEVADSTDSLRTIPEDIFLSDILPKVSDDTFMGDPVLRGQFIEVWSQVAGGFSSPVSVRDVNGKHVVTVPPIFDTSLYKSELGTNEVDSALEELYIRTGSPTGFAGRFLEKRVAPCLDKRVNTGQFQVSWKPVFDHYGLKVTSATSSIPEQLSGATIAHNPFVEEE